MLELLGEYAKLYFRVNALSFVVGLLEWTVGYIVPQHVRESVDRFNKGLCA